MPQMSICLVCYKVKIMEVISINFVMMFLFLQTLQTCSEELYFCFCLLSENTHYFPQGTMLESTLNSGGVVLSRCRHFSEFKRAYLMFHLPLIHIKVIMISQFHLQVPISWQSLRTLPLIISSKVPRIQKECLFLTWCYQHNICMIKALWYGTLLDKIASSTSAWTSSHFIKLVFHSSL